MNIKKVSSVIFSPTGSTKKVVLSMVDKLPIPAEIMDITGHSERNKSCYFSNDELVIFGVPVYGGRLPAPAVESFQKMHGNDTFAVLVATYGNRAYDDALLELKDISVGNGFIPIAAAAFITEHSIMHSVATGRPDADDTVKISDFADLVWDKVRSIQALSDLLPIDVKGNSPYRDYNGVPFKPQSTKECSQCGICAEGCPVAAISVADSTDTNHDICISCMRCVAVCPANARKINKLILAVAEKSFAKKCVVRQEPEIFI